MSLYYNNNFDKYVRDDISFEVDGVKYPSDWFQKVSSEDIENAGFQLVVATNERADDRFYWVSETLDKATLTYVNTPKELQPLKKTWLEQVNTVAYSRLFPSDWMVVKSMETGEPMAADWKQYRANVRTKANESRAAVEAATTVDELASAVGSIQWPHDPNYVSPIEEPVA